MDPEVKEVLRKAREHDLQATQREQQASKALHEAQERERRADARQAEAEQELKLLRNSKDIGSVSPSSPEPEATSPFVKAAERNAAQAEKQAEDADSVVDVHLARAKQRLAAPSSPQDLQQTANDLLAAFAAEDGGGATAIQSVSLAVAAAPGEAADPYAQLLQQLLVLAEKARGAGTVPELEARLASEQVHVTKLQALRGAEIQVVSDDAHRYSYMALGGFVVGLFAVVHFFVIQRQASSESKGALQEPLMVSSPYKEPEWTEAEDTEASVEDWRERALEAQRSLQRTKATLEKAEVQKSSDQDRLTAAEQRIKELEAAKAESEARAQEENEAQQQALTQAASTESETRAREEFEAQRQAQTQAEIDRLRERLELAEAAVRRSDQESQSAQDAARQSQAQALEALSKVDMDAEEQKTRADGLEAQLRETEQELKETAAALDEAREEGQELNAQRSSVQTLLEQQRLEARAKSKDCKTLAEQAEAERRSLSEQAQAQHRSFAEQAEAEKRSLAEEKQRLQQELEASALQHQEGEAQRQKLRDEIEKLSAEVAKKTEEQKRLQQELEEANGTVVQQKEQLKIAKDAALDAAQALEKVRQQASVETAAGKKAAADLQADNESLQESLEQALAEVDVEKARADSADRLAKSRQQDLEHAQQLTEKAKGQLQLVRQELGAECAAAKAQVDVERKLACEAEELSEKCRLDAQAARAAEQEARMAEQEAKAALFKLQRGSTSPRQQASPKKPEASAATLPQGLSEEVTQATTEATEAMAAKEEAVKSIEDPQDSTDLSKAVGS